MTTLIIVITSFREFHISKDRRRQRGGGGRREMMKRDSHKQRIHRTNRKDEESDQPDGAGDTPGHLEADDVHHVDHIC